MTQVEIVRHNPVEELIVNYAPWHSTRSQRPRTFEQFCDMVDTGGKLTGIWELTQRDVKTGEVLKRIFNRNVITDQGANSILQRSINSSGATLPNLFNQMALTNGSGSTTLTTALTNGQTGITALAVASLPASIPDGTKLTLGFGGGSTQTVTVSNGGSAVAAAAVSIPVTSFTANAAYAIGAAVVPQPNYTDNPASLTGSLVSYSGALATGAFVYTPTTGQGNRQVVITQLFQNGTGTNTPVGNYTDAWLVSANPVAATGETCAHEINTPMRCDASNTITGVVTIKL